MRENTEITSKPLVGFYNFSGCSGCLLTILNCEDDLLDIFAAGEVVSFLMANRGNIEKNLDIAFIDGSVTTKDQQEFLLDLRSRTKKLVALGTCACYGGLQAMETGKSSFASRYQRVYGKTGPTIVQAFESKPLDAFVKVDYYQPGCPIDGKQFLFTYSRLVRDLPADPPLAKVPVCTECKWRENECLLLKDKLCLGPITAAGCNARCPSNNTGCVGCFGPADEQNLTSEINLLKSKKFPLETIERKLRIFGGTRFAAILGQLKKTLGKGK
ncbi:MAG: NADH:ubiquinone oxidoreductase [candidate division WOR-3 bacterium]